MVRVSCLHLAPLRSANAWFFRLQKLTIFFAKLSLPIAASALEHLKFSEGMAPLSFKTIAAMLFGRISCSRSLENRLFKCQKLYGRFGTKVRLQCLPFI